MRQRVPIIAIFVSKKTIEFVTEFDWLNGQIQLVYLQNNLSGSLKKVTPFGAHQQNVQ